MTASPTERTPLIRGSAVAEVGAAETAAVSEAHDLVGKAGDGLDDPTKLPTRVRNSILFAVWLGVFLGLYGRLADIFGRRGASLTAIFLFTIGTALCAFAPTMGTLIAGRLIAGMGGGGLMAVSSIICSDLVPLKTRAFYQGLANLFFGAGSGLGGPLGGLVADSIGWRWAFIIQIPLLVMVFVLVYLFVRYSVPGQGKSRSEMVRRIDYFGSLTLIISLGSLLFALSYKNNEGLAWGNPFVWGPLVVFAVFLVVFVAVEAYWAVEPVMPLHILSQRNGIFVCLSNFFLTFTAFSILYFFPMFFEVVMGQSASRSGAHLLPNSIALSCGSLFAGAVIRHTGSYHKLILVTAFVPIITLVGMFFLDEKTPEFLQWTVVIPSGFGYASVITSLLIALVSSVERTEMAVATGLTYLARYVGQVVGVAVSSSVLQAVLTSQLHDRITGPGSEEIITRIREVATSIPELSPHLQRAAIASYKAGLKSVFGLNLGIAVITFLCTLPIKQYALPGSFKEEEEQRERRAQEETGSPE